MLREFTDCSGKRWRVWDVSPNVRTFTTTSEAEAATAASPFPTMEFSGGWLCFESAEEKRRLAPIPPEWETCPLTVLEELCTRAGFSTRRTPSDSPPRVNPS